jgi:hypothetical protein
MDYGYLLTKASVCKASEHTSDGSVYFDRLQNDNPRSIKAATPNDFITNG